MGDPTFRAAANFAALFAKKSENDQDIVAQQVKELDEAGLFRLVTANDVPGTLAHLATAEADLAKRDIVGATPLLIAFLYQHFALGKAIIEAFPVEKGYPYALMTYEDRGSAVSPYRGENALHIAIVHRKLDIIDWLVQRVPDLLDAETTGSFFAPGTPCYLGGTPLLFALASHLLEAATLILAAAAKAPAGSPAAKTSIAMTDGFGNNALHLAVVHDLPDVYDFAIKHAMALYPYACPARFEPANAAPYDLSAFLKQLYGTDKAAFSQFLSQPNGDNLSPLTMAAAMGKSTMFQHILSAQTTTAWMYGPVTAKMIPLRGLEEPYGASPATHVHKTAIECLCSYRRISCCIPVATTSDTLRARLDLLSTFEVKTLIDKKWAFVGGALFHRACVRHVLYTLVLTASTLAADHYRHHPFSVRRGGYSLLADLYILLETYAKVAREIREIRVHGVRDYWHDTGAAMVDTVLKLSQVVMVTGAVVARLQRQLEWEDCFVAGALLGAYMHMLFFLYGFRRTGAFIVMLHRMLFSDAVRFTLVYVSILLGFGTSLYVIVDARDGPGPLGDRLKSLVLAAFAATFSFDEYRLCRMPIPAQLFIFAYMVLVVIVLINLLIAMMGNTYDSIIDGAEQRWYAERVNIMSSLTTGLARDAVARSRLKYAVELGHGLAKERYLQVELVDVEKWRAPPLVAPDELPLPPKPVLVSVATQTQTRHPVRVHDATTNTPRLRQATPHKKESKPRRAEVAPETLVPLQHVVHGPLRRRLGQQAQYQS
ncbi:hypothetical protein SPRG_04056 [Saprolegnia parasitica CBS 223.65]|uniref:Uncharacterized protein n=1 Tax=Saprolegnia parasitica (strain CBS 223.65) TaxID=695850 RepID=A0A067CY28_SAPPC|nr:hypothetical protein SPRG_04056 [Saprolegnia parasitica CBS 223.65]KDO31441.1 hypothetical protein SPRG_04056 [Saprolegnia parasitica CBS 223.65]|eukprot:XP_012198036.1 hypothetical protein SPRG_04056 [Saprolegnia parasitica CBS 223.65]